MEELTALCFITSWSVLVVVLAGGEEWGERASFLQLSFSTMSEHGFRIMSLVLLRELLM